MRIIDEHDLSRALNWPDLIGAIEAELRLERVVSPERQNLEIALPDGSVANLLIMPAWIGGEAIGVKLVTFFPGNGAKGLPTINAGYMLFNGSDGRIEAAMDGDELTARRTAAASALAAKYLAREDASRLLVVGTGQLSAHVVQAHASVRAYRDIRIHGRNAEKVGAVVATLADLGIQATGSTDLEQSCREADVISCVTSATQAVVKGDWLEPATHLDLIGAFKPDMRESDDEAIRKATIFVDTRAGASKAGDLAQPLAAGVITADSIAADLSELVKGEHPGRRTASEITLFKSAGFSLEDLAAARLAAG